MCTHNVRDVEILVAALLHYTFDSNEHASALGQCLGAVQL